MTDICRLIPTDLAGGGGGGGRGPIMPNSYLFYVTANSHTISVETPNLAQMFLGWYQTVQEGCHEIPQLTQGAGSRDEITPVFVFSRTIFRLFCRPVENVSIFRSFGSPYLHFVQKYCQEYLSRCHYL